MQSQIRRLDRRGAARVGFRHPRWIVITAGMTLLVGCSTSVTGAPLRGAAPPTTSSAVTETGGPQQWPSLPDLASSTSEAPPTSGTETTDTPTDPNAGLTVPDDEVGINWDAPPIDLNIQNMTSEDSDIVAAAALEDLFHFYEESFQADFGIDFARPKDLISYDSREEGTVCDMPTLDYVNAFFAPYCDTVAWDRGVMLPDMMADIGVLAPAVILSHELGHSVQWQLGQWDSISTITAEQQADCYAGSFWRWVEEGNSQYFKFNQSEGIRQLLLTLLAAKDPPLMRADVEANGNEDAHGNGFDRTFAGTLGYANGAVRCSQIDDAEIAKRGQQFPFDDAVYQFGNVDITTAVISGILATVDEYFTETQPGYVAPKLVMYAGHTPPTCAGVQEPFPVAYCPDDNTVSYQLAELKKIGTATGGWSSANGDFSALVLLVSRYALAAMHAGNAPITGGNAGLQALCYAGTWANWMRTPHGDYQLSPNDLDKAIYEIVSSPTAASDVSGETNAPIIDRVQALGYGVTTTISECFKEYYR